MNGGSEKIMGVGGRHNGDCKSCCKLLARLLMGGPVQCPPGPPSAATHVKRVIEFITDFSYFMKQLK